MTATALERFFAPDRVVAIVSPGEEPVDGPGERAGEDGEPWDYPGVESTVVQSTGVSAINFDPDDLAVVDVPLQEQEHVLATLAAEPVEAVLLTGGEPGLGVPDGLEAAIQRADLRVLGPGACVEMPTDTGGSDPGTPNESGGIAILAHDRYLGRSIGEWATERGMALGPVVGVGAGIDVAFGEIAATMADRESTDLVLGRSTVVDATVVEAFRGIEAKTPVAVYPGSGADLETTHGFDIPGSAVSRAIVEQAGMVPVESLERMLDGGPALATQPLPDPESVVVVSNAGGPGVMGIDAVGASGLDVARLTEDTITRLKEHVPEHGSARNPLDLLADSGIDVFEAALDVSLADENVGAAVVMSAPSAIFSFEELAEVIVAARRRHDVPIVTALMGGSRTERPAEVLREAGIPNYFDPYRAVGALDLLRRHASTVSMRGRSPVAPGGYDGEEASSWLPRGDRVELTGDDAASFVRSLGVDDVVSPEGGDPVGVEMFVSGHRCPDRGPVVTTGVSTFAQAVGDISVRGVPLGEGDAEEMLAALRAAPVLKGARGREATNTEPVLTALRGLSTLLSREPDVDLVSLPSVTVSHGGLRVERVELARSPPGS